MWGVGQSVWAESVTRWYTGTSRRAVDDEGQGMPEATISLDSHDEELAVFGSRDQYLRQVRDALGVKVLARHGEVRVEGEPGRVAQARRVFEELRGLYRRQRSITSGEVADVIETAVRGDEDDGAGQVAIREGNRLVRPRTDGQARY